MLRVGLAFVFVIALGGARPAAADDHEPDVGGAVGTGASLAVLPLLAGSVLYASGNDDGLRRTATFVAMGGLVVAPVVSHLWVHEYKRAAIFAALPLVALLANVVVLSIDPQTTTYGSAGSRTVYGVALTAATLGATVGLADTFAARDRWRRRHPLLGALY